MHIQSELASQIRSLGVGEGDLVMPHVSMRAVGRVDGGAQGLLDTVLDVVGNTGTVFMVFGADDCVPFDASTSPADPEMGVFAEVFRQDPRTVVSDHAAARGGAIGALATTLTQNQPLHDYYAPGSPLHRFVEANGKALRLGADEDTVTIMHVAEYLAELPHKRRARRRYVRADTGEQWIECLDDCTGIVEWPHGDYFEEVLRSFIAEGLAGVGPVGSCTAELLPSQSLVRFAVKWMEAHLSEKQ